jgi:quinolinate synthase
MALMDADTALLKEEIAELKRTRRAVILAHYYQRPAVQHVADFVGDSLDLSRRAVQTQADVIVFCGVRFMAETAAILNPDKTVLLPEPAAGCDVAETATADAVRRRLQELPEGTALACYVNSSAEVKALADVCCTSANAVAAVERLPAERVLFVPDGNLASFVQERTAKQVFAWDGRCYVHDPGISADAVRDLKRMHPHAAVMVHPECSPAVRRTADFVGSTSQMLQHAAQSPRESFVVGTEEGFVHPLQEQNPHKEFFATGSVCASMRLTTLVSVRRALDRMTNVVTVPADVSGRAAKALNAMLEA